MLYLAYKHADSFEDAVLSNTNVGGENCHRGSALGAIVSGGAPLPCLPARRRRSLGQCQQRRGAFVPLLRRFYAFAACVADWASCNPRAQMGAAAGASGIPRHLIDGLHDGKAIGAEIENYITALFPEEAKKEQEAAATPAGAEL